MSYMATLRQNNDIRSLIMIHLRATEIVFEAIATIDYTTTHELNNVY